MSKVNEFVDYVSKAITVLNLINSNPSEWVSYDYIHQQLNYEYDPSQILSWLQTQGVIKIKNVSKTGIEWMVKVEDDNE